MAKVFLPGLGIDVRALATLRRRFACPCLDWSMRCPHLGGASGAVLLQEEIRRKWLTQELGSRALALTTSGRKAFVSRFCIEIVLTNTRQLCIPWGRQAVQGLFEASVAASISNGT